MKLRKIIVISALGLVLFFGLVAAWWFLSNDAWIRDKIEDTVAEKTARPFSIDGAFTLEWSTNPVLIAENIRFSNPPWAVNPDLARLDKIEISVDLFSLFADQLRINYIIIDGLVIALEEQASGEKSWEIQSGQVEPAATTEAPSTELPIGIGRITLTDFSLLYEATGRTVPLDFNLERLELTQGTDQQLQFITNGRFGGEQFDLAGNLGPISELVAGGKTSHDIRLTMGEIILQSRGSIAQTSTLSGANVKFTFSGPEFEWILTQLALPEFSHGDFDFRLDLQTEGDQTRLSLDGDLGSLRVYAQGGFKNLAGKVTADLVADVSGDDLGGLLEVAGVSAIPHNPFNLKVDIGHAPGLSNLRTVELETGGNTVSVSGQVGDWPKLDGTDLVFSLAGPDLSVWSPMLKMENLPASAFSLHGGISTTAMGLGLDKVSLEIANSRFVVNGTMGEPPAFTGTVLSIEAAGPSLAEFRFLPGLHTAPALPFQVMGDIGNPDDLSTTDIQLALTAASLQDFGEMLAFPLPDEPFRLSTRLQGSPSAFNAEQLEIELGSSDLSGQVSVDLEGQPRVNGVFNSNYLDLKWLQSMAKGKSTGGTPVEAGKQDYFIPDRPIDLSRIDSADSDIEVTVNKIDFMHQSFRDIHSISRITDGNLYLDHFKVRGENGGLLSGTLAVEHDDTSDITSLALSLAGDGVQLSMGTAEGQDPDTIRKTDIIANLSSKGATYRDLASSLNGHVEVVLGPGLTSNAGIDLVFGNFIGELVNMLNPFAKTEKFTLNECAVGIFNIESGLITLDPAVSQTDKMTIVAKGNVDLGTEEVQFTFNTKLRKGIGISASMMINPFVSITGTLKSPVIGLDPAAVAIQGTVAVATAGASLLARSLADRFFSSKAPCEDALRKSREQLESSREKGN